MRFVVICLGLAIVAILLVPKAFSANRAGRLPPQCLRAVKIICVSKADRKVRLVEHGRIVLALWARFGDARGSGYRTHEGLCKVDYKEIRSWSYVFGVVMPFSLYFCGHSQAIHYSYSFVDESYNGASHGCVNTRDWDKMARLFSLVPLGTPVFIYHT